MKPKPRRRRRPTLLEELAAALLEVQRLRGQPIDREKAKAMSAKEIRAMFECDHVVYDTWGGGNHPTNLDHKLTPDHREKTFKKDIPAIRKADRIAKRKAEANPDVVAAAFLESIGEPERKKAVRKIQSQGFRGWRAFDGTPRWKKDK